MNKIELTSALLSDLKEKAEKAMQGEWLVKKDTLGNFYFINKNDWLCQQIGNKEDAEFIAAANPAVVLALIAEIERLEKLVELWRHDYDVLTDHASELKKELERWKIEAHDLDSSGKETAKDLNTLEKEADWLANFIVGLQMCPMIKAYKCRHLDDKEFPVCECVKCWREAARRTVEGKCRNDG